MSYTSQVTNKYYQRQTLGTGKISKGPTEGQQIVAALEKADPVLSKLGEAYIQDKKTDAQTKMQQLYSELGSVEKIEERLKSGVDPELNSMYAESVVDGYLGQLEASEHLEELKVNLGKGYNAETDDLDMFFEEYLPKLEGDKSDTYQRQYYATIEQYKTTLAEQDVKVKAQVAKDRKMSELISLTAFSDNAKDYWEKMDSFVVTIDGKKKLASNGNINEATIQRAKMALQSGDSEEIALMIDVLSYDRGKNGIGALGDANPENQALVSQLVAKHDDKLWEEYTDLERARTIKVSNIVNKWAAGEISDEDMYNQVVAADVKQSEFARELVVNRTNANPAELNQMKNEIINANYLTEADIHEAIKRQGNYGDFAEILQYWRNWRAGFDKAGSPIHMKDPYFKGMVDDIPDLIFAEGGVVDIYGGNSVQNKLRVEAKVFIENEINEFYNNSLQDNGKPPTFQEKQAFESSMRTYVKTHFTDPSKIEALAFEDRYEKATRETAEKRQAESNRLLKEEADKKIAAQREELKVEETVKNYEPDLQVDKLRKGISTIVDRNQYITVQKDKAGNEIGFTFNKGAEIDEHLIAVAANSPLADFMRQNLLTKEEIEMLADDFGISVNRMIGVIGAVKNNQQGAYLLQERQLTQVEKDMFKVLGINP